VALDSRAVSRFALDFDPMATDPGRWGHSLANLSELVFPCLDAAAPRTLTEIGAYAGDITRLLLEWAVTTSPPTQVISIDPEPQPTLVELAEQNPQLDLIRATSLEAIPQLPPSDAIIIDGDHNYYTVSEELRLIAEQAGDGLLPLLICHDVAWPHARRDSYYVYDRIPPEHRQPTQEGGYVHPSDPGLYEGGLVYQWPALREGGAGNGVLTAVEDFLEGREGLRFALVPAFFGLGVIWEQAAPYADALEEILGPWDRNPILARLEANRVLHLASWQLEGGRAAWRQEAINRKNEFLHKLLHARTFELAERMVRLLHRGEPPVFSKDEIRRTIDLP
jgi:methyltransferase family protein